MSVFFICILPFAVPYMMNCPSFEQVDAVNDFDVSNLPETVLNVELKTRL